MYLHSNKPDRSQLQRYTTKNVAKVVICCSILLRPHSNNDAWAMCSRIYFLFRASTDEARIAFLPAGPLNRFESSVPPYQNSTGIWLHIFPTQFSITFADNLCKNYSTDVEEQMLAQKHSSILEHFIE